MCSSRTWVFAALLEVVTIGSIPLLISVVANPADLQKVPLVGSYLGEFEEIRNRQVVLWGGIGFLVVFLIRTALVILSRYMQLHFSATRQVRISSQLFAQYLSAPYVFHLGHNSSELIRNLQTGAMRVGGAVFTQLLIGIQSTLMLVSILCLLLWAEPRVTTFSFAIFGVFGAVFLKISSGRAKALGVLEMKESRRSLQLLRQALEGIKELQVIGKQEFFLRDFRLRMKRMAQAQ